MIPPCPLCGSRETAPFSTVQGRAFLRCGACLLTFVPPGDLPQPATEKARYLMHRHDPADPGYRAFLMRVVEPIEARTAPGAAGLDYGSGPVPALATLLRERGFDVTIYDPFFAPDAAALGRAYDFVTCVETAEHFHAPGRELALLDRLLKPGGVLAVSTGILEDDAAFSEWHYARDLTHACFYRTETLAWIARRLGWALEISGRNLALFVRPA